MKPTPFQSSSLFSSFIILLISVLSLLPSHAYGSHKPFDECAPFSCGNTKNIKYPFWGNGQPEYCGRPGFRIDCEEEQTATMIMMNLKYHVIEINPDSQLLRIARIDLTDRICPDEYFNSTLNFTLFTYTSNDENATLFYDCHLSQDRKTANKFTCSINNIRREARLVSHLISGNETELGCSNSVLIPILARAVVGYLKSELTAIQVLKEGFEVRWITDQLKCRNCAKKGGRCGYNWTVDRFSCFSPLGSSELTSAEVSSGSDPNIKLKVGIGLGASLVTVAIMGIIFFIYQRRKKNPYAPSSYVSQSNTSDFSSKIDMERGGSLYGVQLFTYEQLEEATNNFDSKKELGEGGFGTVYHGKLQDGRTVAVKRLYENNFKRVEQFMNEVDLLTHLRHPHLVSLYGCTSRHSRELLLVYEYISNGTVADHVHGERAKPGGLPWDTRMNIAVETASALAYLHRSDIIHRDVKTNNILLDDNFCVKVADFGLSRLFPLHVTHISTAPQGTPGYVDPEYHECYQLTSKSDVYSFGVVLIELISSMPAVDITRHRHEINLSNMAINKIQSNALDELVDHGLGFDSDYAVRKMITAVAELAFQCLQSGKELRPTMDEVLETLNQIKNKDYDLEKKEELGSPSNDDVGLLKTDLLPHSPDTIMIKWTSTSTTPHTSG